MRSLFTILLLATFGIQAEAQQIGQNATPGNSNTPNQVAITATSGPTLNPYPLLIGHTVLFTAHPSAGNVVNYGVAQPVRWDSSNPAVGVLLEDDCRTPYGGEFLSTICVFGGGIGKATSNIDGTTSNGAVGTLTVSVTN